MLFTGSKILCILAQDPILYGNCPQGYYHVDNLFIRVKKLLLEHQSEGDPEDWHSSNNILVNRRGPRKSARNVNKD